MSMFMKKLCFLFVGLIGSAASESMNKISGISIGRGLCPEGSGRVIVESGHLTLVDTVVTDSILVVLDRQFPMRELELSGYIVCQQDTKQLDKVKVALPTPHNAVGLGYNVNVILESIYLGDDSRKLRSAINSELEFKKFITKNKQTRFSIKPK